MFVDGTEGRKRNLGRAVRQGGLQTPIGGVLVQHCAIRGKHTKAHLVGRQRGEEGLSHEPRCNRVGPGLGFRPLAPERRGKRLGGRTEHFRME